MALNALLPVYKLEMTVFIYHCLWVTINPTSPKTLIGSLQIKKLPF